MQVYIEEVFLNNFVIDFVILALTLRLTHQKFVWGKVVLSASFGVIFSIILPLTGTYGVYTYILKAICGIVMCIIATNKKGFRSHLFVMVVFVTITFVFGGLCMAVVFMLGGTFADMSNYNLPLPLWVLIGGVVVYGFLLYKAAQSFLNQRKLSKFYYSLSLVLGNKQHNLTAYLDSGNTLVDNVTNKGVVVIDYTTFNKMAKVDITDLLLHKPIDKLKNSHYITYTTIAGKQQSMLVFEAESILADGKPLDCVLGVSIAGFNKCADFQALLSPMSM